MRRRWVSALAIAAIGCAHKAPPPRETLPESTQIIAVPQADEQHLDPSGIAHILRGLYFMQHGHSSAAIPHFRLALIYDNDSGYLHQKLAEAWLAENRLDKAREVLAHGLERAPNDAHLNTIAGELARRSKHFDEAALRFEHGVVDRSTVVVAGTGLVDVLAWQGKAADAEKRSIEVMSAFPDNDDLATFLAGTLEDHGRLDAALIAYRKARELAPGSRAAAVGEMRVLDLEGKFGEAAASLTQLFAFEPDDVALYAQVMRLFERASSPSAQAYRIEALRIAGDDLIMRSFIAASDVYEGKSESGTKLLDDIARKVTSEPQMQTKLQVLTFVAETYMQAGAPQRCADELSAIFAAPVLRARAECLATSGQIDDALAQLVIAVKSGATGRDAAMDAARVVANDDDEFRARKRLSAFLKVIAPSLGKNDVSLATASLAAHYGRDSESLALISAVYVTSKDDIDLKLRYADALARVDHLDESVGILRGMIEEQPDEPTFLNALGFTLADAGRDLDEAEVYLRHAYRLASDESFIVDSLGWLMHRRGKEEAAERLLKRAMFQSPRDPEVLWHLGEVYKARGKGEDARGLYVKALAAHPPKQLKTRIQQSMTRA